MGKKSIKVTLPIYTSNRKGAKMIGMNWLIGAHHMAIARLKKAYSIRVGKALPKDKSEIPSPYRVHYKIYYKNKVSDGSNMVAVVEKFFLDALQDLGVIQEDNVQHHLGSTWDVIEQDRVKPRIEAEVFHVE